MIQYGYPGIENGKYTEEQFLNSISPRKREFYSHFVHRDTKLTAGGLWRVQGVISIDIFNKWLKAGKELSGIMFMAIDLPDCRSHYKLTITEYIAKPL